MTYVLAYPYPHVGTLTSMSPTLSCTVTSLSHFPKSLVRTSPGTFRSQSLSES